MRWFRRNTVREKEVWHLWFAWRPVTVGRTPDRDEKRVWLEYVERCGELTLWIDGPLWSWEYRERQNKNKEGKNNV